MSVGRNEVRRLGVARPAHQACVAVFGAKLRFALVPNEIASGVEPPGALLALDDQLALVVGERARRAVPERVARTAERTVLLVGPGGFHAGIVGSAHLANGTPLAFPLNNKS